MSQTTPGVSKAPDGSLDAFITSKKAQPEPLVTSQEIRDRGSIFVANIYQASTPEDAKARINHLKHYVHRAKKASHEVAAWRCMVLKPSKSGLEGPEAFELMQGSKDDGESWAGGKVLKVMQNLAVIDAVVIVSRWYGGTMLGPARFSHIETCAEEVCKVFKRTEELQDCITTLRTLDDILAGLRQQLAELNAAEASSHATPDATSASEPTSTSDTPVDVPADASSSLAKETTGVKIAAKQPDYKSLDLTKAKRLMQARESSIKSVRALITKKSTRT